MYGALVAFWLLVGTLAVVAAAAGVCTLLDLWREAHGLR